MEQLASRSTQAAPQSLRFVLQQHEHGRTWERAILSCWSSSRMSSSSLCLTAWNWCLEGRRSFFLDVLRDGSAARGAGLLGMASVRVVTPM